MALDRERLEVHQVALESFDSVFDSVDAIVEDRRGKQLAEWTVAMPTKLAERHEG